MKFYIGVTDIDWFNFLSAQKPEEVNFWRPGGNQTFSVIEPGAPFLFKLHSPQNYIVGGGYFVNYTILPISIAWKIFDEKNGTNSFESLSLKIFKYKKDSKTAVVNPNIGCIILSAPFFFEKSDWIDIPEDWSPNIVQGKSYDSTIGIGKRVWEKVQSKLFRSRHAYVYPSQNPRLAVAEGLPLYGNSYLTKARLGQSTFRALVLDAYNRRCAVTGEKTMPVLEAAHIKPVSSSGPNNPQNGLLLRSDLHILFDQGYVTVTKDLRVEVSKRIKDEFENGRDYYAYHGNSLKVIPGHDFEKPSNEFVEWHNQNVYKS